MSEDVAAPTEIKRKPLNKAKFTGKTFKPNTGAVTTRKASKPYTDIMTAITDPKIFGPWFSDLMTWGGWIAFLRTLFGLTLSPQQRRLYEESTNRKKLLVKEFREAWLICGRRAGKSRALALVAIYLAMFKDWKQYLSPGERGKVVVIATDRRQARVIFRYIEAFLKNIPLFEGMIQRETAEVFELINQIDIEVHTANFRTVRGYTIVAALLDEIAFFRSDDFLNPDFEILEALRPGMASVPGSMMLCASSPHARKGELWKTYKDHFGKEDSEILVWKAPTWKMNPTIDPRFIKAQYEKNPQSANAEYGAEFRSDVETYITEEIIEAVMVAGRREIPPLADTQYIGFVDPSGGSSDSFTLAIGHYDGDTRVLDLVRESKPPFNPDNVVKTFCDDLKRYRVGTVYGDRYGGEWARQKFRAQGLAYEVSKFTKSELYLNMLPHLNSGQCELLDNTTMKNQFVSLERRTSPSGKESVDHPRGSHDDVANAIAGCLCVTEKPIPLSIW